MNSQLNLKSISKVTVHSLKEGMMLARDVLDSNGVVIISKNKDLTESQILKLQDTVGLSEVYVYENESFLKSSSSEKSIPPAIIQDLKTKDLLIDLTNILKTKLFNPSEDAPVTLKDINEITFNILDSVSSGGSIIRNIMQMRTSDDLLYRHSLNVSILSCMLAKWLNFDEKQIHLISRAAILHDIGKTKVNQTVLNKPSQLNDDEKEEMKKHTIYGYNMVKQIPFMDKSVYSAILMHHEREDGSGYPLGLKSDQIHPFAKIIAIADMFDAMTSSRIYRNDKFLPFDVLEIFQKECIGKLDVEYMMVFIKNLISYYEGSSVILNNNQQAKIIKMNLHNIKKPLVQTKSEFIDLSTNSNLAIEDLIHFI